MYALNKKNAPVWVHFLFVVIDCERGFIQKHGVARHLRGGLFAKQTFVVGMPHEQGEGGRRNIYAQFVPFLDGKCVFGQTKAEFYFVVGGLVGADVGYFLNIVA